MKRTSVFAWAMGLTLIVPAPAESQQDPALIARGAEVYSTTCGRCHGLRSGAERTDREWVAIIAHMRARANLAKSQAAAVLAFLQSTNVPEGGTPQGSTPPSVTSVPNGSFRAYPHQGRRRP